MAIPPSLSRAVSSVLLLSVFSTSLSAAEYPYSSIGYRDASSRPLTYEELEQLSDEALGALRNEIFARHGYDFAGTRYGAYFSQQPWYFPQPGYRPTSEAFPAVEQHNIVAIRFVEGRKAYDRGEYEAAYKVLLPVAEQQVPAAQNYIGAMYEKGNVPGQPQDMGKALEWYNQAYLVGDDWAANKIGTLLRDGIAFPHDPSQSPALLAASYFAKGAQSGNAQARANLLALLEAHPEVRQAFEARASASSPPAYREASSARDPSSPSDATSSAEKWIWAGVAVLGAAVLANTLFGGAGDGGGGGTESGGHGGGGGGGGSASSASYGSGGSAPPISDFYGDDHTARPVDSFYGSDHTPGPISPFYGSDHTAR